MKRKFLSLFFALSAILTLCSCKEGSFSKESTSSEKSSSQSLSSSDNTSSAASSDDKPSSSEPPSAAADDPQNDPNRWNGTWTGDGYVIEIYEVDEKSDSAYVTLHGKMTSDFGEIYISGDTLTGEFSYNPQDYNDGDPSFPYEEKREFTLVKDNGTLHFHVKVTMTFYGGEQDFFERSADLTKVIVS